MINSPQIDALPSDILIVDDNPENLKVLGDFFTRLGFNVRVARDGQQALTNAAAAPPEIILLDIHMPVMDGYETCARMKEIEALRDCPIIFLSALGETFNKVRAFECGGVDYITKPFHLEEVKVRVGNHLRTARLLAESKAGFRASFEQATVGMGHFDAIDARFLAANPRLCSMFGRSDAELSDMPLKDLLAPESVSAIMRDYEAVRAGELRQPESEVRCLRQDGTDIWCQFTFSLVTVHSTGKQYVAAIIEDFTEHRRAVEERRRLAAALEQTAEAIAITDADGLTQYVNPAYETAFGVTREATLGTPLGILSPDNDNAATAAAVRATISQGGVWSGRIVKQAPGGKEITEEYTVSPVRDGAGSITNYVAVVRDLTRQLRLEQQVRQSQKMEAIGTLAAGIAHDFNNVLTAIVGFTGLSIEELPEDHPVRADLQQVLNAAHHATELVQQILAFARQSPLEIKPIRLQRVVEDALKLLRRSIPPTVEITCKLDPACSAILADATAIHQIVMNLCTNAYHAMEKEGGSLTVRVTEVSVGDESEQSGIELAAGGYARLDISDTGHGMDKETVQRIFDPYFTTKDRGKGTGLGLATVHGIVTDLKGGIYVYSEPGSGSTFTVFVPIAPVGAVVDAPTPAEAEHSGRGTERVLFIDDERAICLFAQKALTRLGYQCTALSSPRAALDLFRGNPGGYDIVITDEMMPELRGSALLPELRAINPKVPVILYSGFAERVRGTMPEQGAFDAYVMKPMVVSELTRTIRALFDR